MSSADRLLTMADAAELAGVSVDTIKRDLKAGRYPNASRADEPNAPWMIPVTDLAAAGRYELEPETDAQTVIADRRERRDVALLTQKVETLQAREADLLAQLERESARAERFEQAVLRLLDAGAA